MRPPGRAAERISDVSPAPTRARNIACRAALLQLRWARGLLQPGTCYVPERRRSRAMKSLVIVLGVVLAACTADTTKLNEKIDKLDKKIDALTAQVARGG